MRILLTALLFTSLAVDAQLAYNFSAAKKSLTAPASFQPVSFPARRKLFQRNTGMIIGLQRGKYTSLEFGGEAHWRKISLLKPNIIGATANLAYNFGNNVLGYHAGVWKKQGRVNLTYGADINYFTDFNNRQSFGIGPSIGFRFFGLHLVNGYTLLTKKNTKNDEAPLPVNTFYMSLRYYFPVKNKFTWDRQTMKKKKARKKERIKRQEDRRRDYKKNDTENKRKWSIF
jgi:hypothetical protein